MRPPLACFFALLSTLPWLPACAGESWEPSSPPTIPPGGSGAGEGGSGGTNLGEIAGKNDGGAGASGEAGGVAGAGTGGAENAGSAGAPGGAGEGGAGAGGAAGQGGAGSGGQGGGGACQPGEFSCLGDLLRQCTEQGQFAPKEACGTKLCSAEQGKCMACAPGSTKGCVSAGEKGVCAEDGSTYVPVACPEELPFCNQGECVLCLDASVCPAPKSPCLQAACIAGKCGVKPYPQGYTPEEQTAGDCRRVECDGKGDTVLVPDSTDPPKSDLSCVGYVCEEGKATPFNKPAGASCGEGCYCNGKGNVGKCIPGTSTCNEGVQEYCDDGWVVKTVCKEEQPACSEGSCRGVTQVVAGGDHACAVLTNQRVHCWGRNHVGQLGLGTNHPTQAQFGAVEGLAGVESLAAGDHHTCAIIKGGKVFCWGDNEFGQVGAGAGSLGYYTSPTEVKGLSDVIQISLGRGFSCALNATGKVSCWGRNHPNLITTGWNQPNVFSPKLIPLEPASQITTGNAHACILAKTGNVVCWGSCEFWQKGGAPSAPCGESWDAPAVTAGLLPGVTQVQAGGDHTCALSPGGVQCWGRNDKGQLGIKKSSNQEPPTLTEFPKPSKAGMLALGTDYTCLVADGSVSCVGWNMIGQLGRNYLPTPGVHPEFEVLPGAVQAQDGMPLSGVVQISARTDFSLVLRTDGNLLGWGNGQHGNIFGGSSSPDPSPYYLAAYIPFVN